MTFFTSKVLPRRLSLELTGFLIIAGVFSGFECHKSNDQQNFQKLDRFEQMRKEMIDRQIKGRGIKDERVLEALQKVPRHQFVPEDLAEEAYSDGPLPIGKGQTISQPYIVAYMTEQLNLEKSDKVLEIGTGSGYQAAILAELVDTVYTVEIIPDLARQAQKTLEQLGYNNVKCKVGNGFFGWPEFAPYDAIIVTAAPEEIPQPLLDQLANGGRLIIPVGDFFQELILARKEDSKIKKEKKLPVRFVPLTGEPE
jgi:protein-L-isoaspartate(D-aspartate) O-methyltransferase